MSSSQGWNYEKQANELAQMIRKLGYEANIFMPVHATNDPERKDFLIKFMVGKHSIEFQCEGPRLRLLEIINDGQTEKEIPIEGNPGVGGINDETIKKIFAAEFDQIFK